MSSLKFVHFIRDNLAVCGFAGIGKRDDFAERGFHAHLQCAEPFDPWLPEVCEVLTMPFMDGLPIPQEVFERAKEWFLPRWQRGEKILISCAAGRSRSVSMASALLAAAEGIPFRAALEEVLGAIPDAYPHPVVLVSAARLVGETLSYDQLNDIYERIAEHTPYPWPEELIRGAAEA